MSASSWWQEQYDLAFPPVIEPEKSGSDASHAVMACPEPENVQVAAPEGTPGSQIREPEARIIELRPQCAATSKQSGERCRRRPHPGSSVCLIHGAGTKAALAKAERNVQEQAAWAAAAGRLTEDERQLYSGDPVSALEYVIARSHALTARLTAIVDNLADGELRYRGPMGEQIHGALSAMQRSLKDTAAMSERAISLGIDARRQRLQEEQLTALTIALEATLAELGLDLAQQHKARHVLSRRLHAIEGGVAPATVPAEVIDDETEERAAKARHHGPPVQ